MNNYEAALTLREKGISTIPIQAAVKGDRSTGKKPAIATWKEFQERLPTVAEIEQWHKKTRNNIAIVTGSVSGLVVVDCDSQDGLEYAMEICDPTGVIVETGGGGRHLYYRLPEGMIVGNRARINGLGLDLRAEGGYVVAPPSTHWSGEKYKYRTKGELAEFDPYWFAKEEAYPMPSQSKIETSDYEEAKFRARCYIAKIKSVAGEGGDNALFRAACALTNKFGLLREDAIEELRIFNCFNCEPKWPDIRLIHKIDESLKLEGSTNQ